MCYNQTGDISTLDGTPLKLVDKFTYLGSSVSSTEKDIDTKLTKAWTAINRLSIIWKSDLTDKRKRSFFQAAVTSTLLYGYTTWTLTKRLEKKLDGNYTRMLRAILNKSWQQYPTRHQLYGHLPPITKTIQVRRTIYIYIYKQDFVFNDPQRLICYLTPTNQAIRWETFSLNDTIYPTPPLGQDMTQGQFFQSFPSPRLVASPRPKNLVCSTIYP